MARLLSVAIQLFQYDFHYSKFPGDYGTEFLLLDRKQAVFGSRLGAARKQRHWHQIVTFEQLVAWLAGSLAQSVGMDAVARRRLGKDSVKRFEGALGPQSGQVAYDTKSKRSAVF